MKAIAGQVAQGDVLLTKIDALPDGAKKLRTKTIARGELTGHHHTFAGDAELYELDGKGWVVVGEEGAELKHQEHAPLVFDAGVFEYAPQSEPDPFTGIRRVSD